MIIFLVVWSFVGLEVAAFLFERIHSSWFMPPYKTTNVLFLLALGPIVLGCLIYAHIKYKDMGD